MKLKLNVLLDMVFEDDSKLLGLLMRYSEPSEIDELKNEIVKYISTQTQDIKTEMNQYKIDYTSEVYVDPDHADPMGDVSILKHNLNSSFLDGESRRFNARDEKT